MKELNSFPRKEANKYFLVIHAMGTAEYLSLKAQGNKNFMGSFNPVLYMFGQNNNKAMTSNQNLGHAYNSIRT